jgi:hypothetical protein
MNVERVSEVALKRGEARRTLILKSKLRLVSVQYRDVLGHLIDFDGHVFRSRAAAVPARASLQSLSLEEKTTDKVVSASF